MATLALETEEDRWIVPSRRRVLEIPPLFRLAISRRLPRRSEPSAPAPELDGGEHEAERWDGLG